jgi:signal transduction histidine kinase
MERSRFRMLSRYGVAIVAAASAVLVRYWIDPLLAHTVPFATPFVAVAIAAAFGGRGPGMVAALLGILGVWFMFVPPRLELSLNGTPSLIVLLIYVLFSAVIVALFDLLRSSIERAKSLAREASASRDELERLHRELEKRSVELESANQSLARASAAKSTFIAVAAHELRGPLQAMLAASEGLRALQTQDPRLAAFGQLLQRQTGQARRLVADLLDYGRVDLGRLSVERTLVDLDQVLTTSVEAVRQSVQERNQMLSLCPPTQLHVMGDQMRLVQVFSNLLQNASKFTPDGGHIFLETGTDASGVTISVRDNGAGIEAQNLTTIFEPFAQEQSSTSATSKGMGLGLFLVRTFVDLHGGRISAYSDGKGKGAVFRVWLPAMTPADAGQDDRDAASGEGNGRDCSGCASAPVRYAA